MYIYKNKYFYGKEGVIGVNGDKSTLFYVWPLICVFGCIDFTSFLLVFGVIVVICHYIADRTHKTMLIYLHLHL
jgi:hypothetical protein